MKFAVIKSGGKQYKVSEGDVVDLERLSVQDKKVLFDDVLLYSDGAELKVGQPYVKGVQVTGLVLEDIRGKKIRVAKYRAKVRFRRTTGHRQALSRVKIESIGSLKPVIKSSKSASTAQPRAQKLKT